MKHLHSKATLSLVIFCLLSSVIGYSSWIIYNPDSNTRTQTITTTEEKKVCFIGSTYYTSIEKAISVANSSTSNVDVWVVPGTIYTIKSGFTINRNVTLNLPFKIILYLKFGKLNIRPLRMKMVKIKMFQIIFMIGELVAVIQ